MSTNISHIGSLIKPTAGLIHFLVAKSVTDSNKMQEWHESVGRKIVLHGPAPYSLFIPVSFFISPCFANTHLPCFSVYSPLPVQVTLPKNV